MKLCGREQKVEAIIVACEVWPGRKKELQLALDFVPNADSARLAKESCYAFRWIEDCVKLRKVATYLSLGIDFLPGDSLHERVLILPRFDMLVCCRRLHEE